MVKSKIYEEKCLQFKKDYEHAIQSERQVRKELNRLSLVNQALINRINGGHKFNEKQSDVNEVYQDTMILR